MTNFEQFLKWNEQRSENSCSDASEITENFYNYEGYKIVT